MELAEWQEGQRALREAVAIARDARSPSSTQTVDAPQESPLVSVIVAAWNASDTIARCLEHLVTQDYDHVEIVLVDDGSTDSTLAAAREAVRGARPLIVISSGRNRGLSRARNAGLAAAHGEVVAFIDADGFADPRWVSALVGAFAADPGIGGVASTVFIDANPMVLNGAGGTANRQGWSADLAMGDHYETAKMGSEALYAMGCGMAFRRAALQRIGGFDDRIRNYYDDVDYGIRVWRAGYRVAIAENAWVDHGWDGDAVRARRALLCERHRMRVVLTHAPVTTLSQWLRHELRSLRGAAIQRRILKLKACVWNASHAASVLAARWRLRGAPRPPAHLVDGSWGDDFPVGLAPVLSPRPEGARAHIDMSDPTSEAQLLYGWFPVERSGARARRWTAQHAAAVVRLEAPAGRLRLDYAHPPEDTGGVQLVIRRLRGADAPREERSIYLGWQYISRSVENHPLTIGPGDFELVLHAHTPFSSPPRESRRLGCAVTSISFHPGFEPTSGGLDMASPGVDAQLVKGWFEAEEDAGLRYRWSTHRAAAVVRLDHPARVLELHYRLPPRTAGVRLSLSALDRPDALWSAWVSANERAGWHNGSFPVALGAGQYLLTFEAKEPWCNPAGRDPELWPENRSLGIAVASALFDRDPPGQQQVRRMPGIS